MSYPYIDELLKYDAMCTSVPLFYTSNYLDNEEVFRALPAYDRRRCKCGDNFDISEMSKPEFQLCEFLKTSCWCKIEDFAHRNSMEGVSCICCGNTPFHLAFIHKSILLFNLFKRSADVKAKNNHGETLLHLACYNGEAAQVETFLFQGADIYARESRKNRMPLHIAIIYNTNETIEELVKFGATFFDRDALGNTPMSLAIETGNTAAFALFMKRGAWPCVDYPKYAGGQTLLHLAAASEKAEFVDMSIQAGAKVNAINDDKMTPMHVAALHGNFVSAMLLMRNGAVINVEDKWRRTPLLIFQSKYLEMEPLLQHSEFIMNFMDNLRYMANCDKEDISRLTTHTTELNQHKEITHTTLELKDVNMENEKNRRIGD